MKTLLSFLLVLVAGVAGLALVFTDLIPVPPGWARIAAGAVLYVAAGWILGRLNTGRRPLRWALGAAWGLILLGGVGLWISLTDPASGDLALAALFVLGPATAALVGGWLASRDAATR